MVTESFVMTAFVDRIQSLLSVKFVCNQTGDLIHREIAHKYSGVFADEIAEILQTYNIDVKYGNILEMNNEYTSVFDILDALNEKVIDYQNKLNMCYKIALDGMDIHVSAELDDIIKKHNKIVAQVILLLDKIDLYKDNIMAFDHDIKDFWILEDEY